MKNAILALVSLLCVVCSFQKTYATHAMGAEITYECISGNSYQITLSFYRDCSGVLPPSAYTISVYSSLCSYSTSMIVTLQAGFPIDVSPLCPAQLPFSECNGGNLPGVQKYEYKGNLTLPQACRDWTFGFKENYRNTSITTLDKPGSTYLYVESVLNNLDVSCNDSPTFSNIPTPFVCLGQPYVYNHGAVDAQGDSLVYSLVTALHGQATPVTYLSSFNGNNPMPSTPTVAIDVSNGNVTMNPTALAVGVMAVRVSEYRNGVLIGSVTRDMQVTVLNCSNQTPVIGAITNLTGGVLLGPQSIEVCANTPISFTIPGVDADVAQNLIMSWNNGIPGASFSATSGTNPVSGTFSWTPTSANNGSNTFVINLGDNGCPLFGKTALAIEVQVRDGVTAGPDKIICGSGSGTRLSVSGGTVHNWRVISGSAGSLSCTNCSSPVATPAVTTTYEVTGNLPCNPIDTITVDVIPGFNLAMSADTGVCEGASVPLDAIATPAGAYSYLWSPPAGLSSTISPLITATPTVSTNYKVVVTDLVSGCTRTDSIQVNVSQNELVAIPTSSASQYCAGTPVNLLANVAGASCTGYSVQSIPYRLTPGSGSSIVLGDEGVSTGIPIGFSFEFYCNTYSSLFVSSNGWLTFSGAYTSDPQYVTGSIPGASDPNAMIAFAWDDLDPGSGGAIEYFTVGTAPNRKFVLSLSNVPHYSCSSCLVSMQVILEEGTNAIEFHNTRIDNHGATGTMTQGIEDDTGIRGLTVAGRNASTWSATNDAFRISLAATAGTYSVSWQSPLGSPIGTGDNISVTPSASTTYYAVVSDASGDCVTTTSLPVSVAYVDAGPDQYINFGDTAILDGTYVGPPPTVNCNAYTRTSIPYSWESGSGTSLSIASDGISSSISLGFSFDFYCNTFSSVRIAEDGFISFNATAGNENNTSIPSAGNPNGMIAGVWEDLKQRTSGSYNPRISYQRLGTAPNRRFVVKYEDMVFYRAISPSKRVDFQIVLYEGTNVVEIHTKRVDGSGGDQATQGIESPNGQNGMAVPGRNFQNFTVSISSPDAYRFTPPSASIQYSWSNPQYLNDNSLEDPKGSPPFDSWFVLTVNNGTCILRDSARIFVQPLPIELLHFDAQKAEGNVLLSWKSKESGSSEFFAVERSWDGIEFVEIERVPAKGTSDEIHAYAYLDTSPQDEMNLYRLAMIDANGQTRYSSVREVFFTPKAQHELLAVYPNPSRKQFYFKLHLGRAAVGSIEIFGMDGRMIKSKTFSTSQAESLSQMIDLGEQPAGIYLYRVTIDGNRFDGKISLIK